MARRLAHARAIDRYCCWIIPLVFAAAAATVLFR
jgi:hypothetical protein